MVGDYISREAAMPDGFCVGVSCQECPFCDDPIKGGCKVARFIDAIPAANVAEVRYCSFALEEARRRESVYKCSNCGNYLTVRADTLNGGRGDMNYCPFCGGKVKHRGQDE